MSADTEAPEVKALLKAHFVPQADSQRGVTTAPAKTRGVSKVKLGLQRHLIFVVTVLLPTLSASVYYGLIASDVYVSESRFLVRTPEKQVEMGLLGNLLQGTGLTHSQDDTYSVRDFILSRDALRELDQTLGIHKAFSGSAIDIFNRFAALYPDHSFEAFYRYYGKHVGVDYDPVSSISTLTVRAYTPQDAYRINEQLLEMSERLVNSLNNRSREDLVRYAENEVKSATDKARDASLALLAYRSSHSVFEPDKQASIQLEGVAKLEGELISTEAQLAQIKKLSPDNPQIVGLDSRAETLRNAITTEAAKVTSPTDSLSARAPEFERIALQSQFADKELGAALAELETARNDAARQQLYLERLVQPDLPDRAMQPRRARSVFTVFLLGLVLWGVASLVLASIREHVE